MSNNRIGSPLGFVPSNSRAPVNPVNLAIVLARDSMEIPDPLPKFTGTFVGRSKSALANQ